MEGGGYTKGWKSTVASRNYRSLLALALKGNDCNAGLHTRNYCGCPVLDKSGWPVLDFSGCPVLNYSGCPVLDYSGCPMLDYSACTVLD